MLTDLYLVTEIEMKKGSTSASKLNSFQSNWAVKTSNDV